MLSACSKYTASSRCCLNSILALQALEAELVGIDSNLLQKLPPEVARQLSQRAIVGAAAETASRGAGGSASVDLLRRTTSRNSAQGHPVPEGYLRGSQDDQAPAALGRNLSVITSSNRRVSKTPSLLANNQGWRFTEDEIASQNAWRGQKDGEAPFKGLNYKGGPPPQLDPAGMKYATQESYKEYRDQQEAGVEEQPLEWTVHQHTRPITDSEAAEMYHKSMEWKHRNALRWAEPISGALSLSGDKCPGYSSSAVTLLPLLYLSQTSLFTPVQPLVVTHLLCNRALLQNNLATAMCRKAPCFGSSFLHEQQCLMMSKLVKLKRCARDVHPQDDPRLFTHAAATCCPISPSCCSHG